MVLTGEGSDELLAGYGKYPRIAWNWRAGTIYERIVPAHLRVGGLPSARAAGCPGASGATHVVVPRDGPHAGGDVLRQLRGNPPGRSAAAARRRRGAGDARRCAYALVACVFRPPNGHSTLLDRLLYADMKTYLVELLMKQDQMSMAASIESRVPFLDHKLVEFAAHAARRAGSCPGWTTKRILREAMKDVLPPIDPDAPEDGFPGAVRPAGCAGGWNARRARRAARSPLARARDHRSVGGRRAARAITSATGRTDGADRIWSLLNLELWYRTFIDGEGVQTLPVRTFDPDAGHAEARSMRILWLKTDLLLPLDKGGRLRSWHLMRHLAKRHEITYLSFADGEQRSRGHA